jgi:predicted site-specific integrase-resolvase
MEPVGDKYDFAAAQVDYAAGGMSMRAVADRHGIPEATLRRYAKLHGWVKGASATKRELVKEALAGVPLDAATDDADVTQEFTHAQVRQRQVAEAGQDVQDMQTGLEVARRCMQRLLAMVDQVDSPNDVKRVVEANKAAVETIRKIRSLDEEAAPAETNVSVTVDEGFSELRAAFKKRLEGMNGTADPA